MLDRRLARLKKYLPEGFKTFAARFTRSHRRFVTQPGCYDLASASQFSLLTLLGLRETHTLLDVGCGPLRSGRLFIAYLEPGRYFGIEPERWLVESAIRHEIGRDLVRLKRPRFDHGREFRLSVFARRFDFILANSIFSHAAPAQVRACLAEAAKTLEPDGIFLASYLAGSADYSGATWVYPQRVEYTEGFLRRLAAEVGLRGESVGWPYNYGEGCQTWIAFTLAESHAAG